MNIFDSFPVQSEFKIIMFIEDNTKQKISKTDIWRQTTMTPNTVFKALNALENKGLITFEKSGRNSFISCTKEGSEVGKALNKIYTQHYK